MDPQSRAANTRHGNEVLPQHTTHLIQRARYNEEVCTKIHQAIGPHEDLLTIVKTRKLKWYGHVSSSSGLAKTILQGTVKGGKKTRQTAEEAGRQHREMDRPGVRQVPESRGEQRQMEETDREVICGAPTTPVKALSRAGCLTGISCLNLYPWVIKFSQPASPSISFFFSSLSCHPYRLQCRC